MKELNYYKEKGIALLNADPKKTAFIMVSILFIGVAYSLIDALVPNEVNREIIIPKNESAGAGFSITKGIGDIITATSSVSEAYSLEAEVKSILGKEILTKEDSLQLLKALDKLNSVQRSVKPMK